MKKLIICLLPLVLTISSFSQQTQFSKEDYLEKSKKQNTGAWVMLGTGTALATGGVVWGASKGVFCDCDYTGPNIMFFTGLGLMVGSIPIFIASGKNKRKAMSMSFKFQHIPQLPNTTKINQPIPSFNLKVSL